jgi:hypothetical protein
MIRSLTGSLDAADAAGADACGSDPLFAPLAQPTKEPARAIVAITVRERFHLIIFKTPPTSIMMSFLM